MKQRGVFALGAVREVQPEDVDARGNQCVEELRLARCRTERGDYLGVSHRLILDLAMGNITPQPVVDYLAALRRDPHERLAMIDREGRTEGLPLVYPDTGAPPRVPHGPAIISPRRATRIESA
jgi:hypothetical protein